MRIFTKYKQLTNSELQKKYVNQKPNTLRH